MPSTQGKLARERLDIATGVPPVLAFLTIAALLMVAWGLTYAAGGTRTALPHMFYFPIVLAAGSRGPSAGAVTGIAATILCGPLMLLDVASGEAQTVLNWAIRGIFFTTVGVTVGGVSLWMQKAIGKTYNQEVAHFISRMLPNTTAATTTIDDADRDWTPEIEQILRDLDFHPVFQPMYRFDSGELFTVEALTRFHTDPPQPPNVWFDRATAAGLGIELELATLHAAVDAYYALDIDAPISVNASPACLIDPRLAALFSRLGERQIVIEVTEHAIINDYPVLREALKTFNIDNIRFAIDDAGAGFASFRHILNLNPDIIKLDVTLVRNMEPNTIQYALAENLVKFAHQINAHIVVEGIETIEDLTAWRTLGADAAQGFFLARPAPTAPATQSHRLTTISLNAVVLAPSAIFSRKRRSS